jgi:uncharacterized protein YdcH (DUF465 family)
MKRDHPSGQWPTMVTGRIALPSEQEGSMPDREVLVQRLTAENDEFRRLRDEHRAHEEELAALQASPFLTTEQQWRVSELKKLKLMAKDAMEVLIRQHADSARTPA